MENSILRSSKGRKNWCIEPEKLPAWSRVDTVQHDRAAGQSSFVIDRSSLVQTACNSGVASMFHGPAALPSDCGEAQPANRTKMISKYFICDSNVHLTRKEKPCSGAAFTCRVQVACSMHQLSRLFSKDHSADKKQKKHKQNGPT